MMIDEFLLARIAEREADVLAANDIHASGPIAAEDALARVLDEDRARAECDAKRQIVKTLDDDPWCLDGGHPYIDFTLRTLALPYADHPDYDEEWRP